MIWNIGSLVFTYNVLFMISILNCKQNSSFYFRWRIDIFAILSVTSSVNPDGSIRTPNPNWVNSIRASNRFVREDASTENASRRIFALVTSDGQWILPDNMTQKARPFHTLKILEKKLGYIIRTKFDLFKIKNVTLGLLKVQCEMALSIKAFLKLKIVCKVFFTFTTYAIISVGKFFVRPLCCHPIFRPWYYRFNKKIL